MANHPKYIMKSAGYGLTARNNEGYNELWKMGQHGYLAGLVSDPDNFHYAIDVALEEMRSLVSEVL